MSSRIPLVVAVVGALLVGGATTGTTRASWTSQAPLRSSAVASGQMSYTATTPAGVTVNRAAGATADATFVLDDTSVGKNLGQRIKAIVTSMPSGVSAAIGTTCAGSGSSVDVDTTPTSADQTLCVRITSSPTAVSGNVTINLSSAQRPTAGWTTPTVTRTIAVTVPQGGPNPPTMMCSANQSTPSARTFTWSNVGAGVTYQLYRQGPGASTFTTLGSPTSTTSYTEDALGNSQSSLFRIKSIQNGVESAAFSSTVTITRNGNSANYNCVVTP